MSEDSTKSFKNAFSQFLKEERLENRFKQKQVVVNWEQIMGKTIASRTSKVFFKDKVLYVKLTSAPLKQELFNSKDKVLALLQKEIGSSEIEDVRFL